MCTVEKSNWQLVLFVKEHCWFFYDYFLSEQKATETNDNKTARALFAELKTQCKFSVNY